MSNVYFFTVLHWKICQSKAVIISMVFASIDFESILQLCRKKAIRRVVLSMKARRHHLRVNGKSRWDSDLRKGSHQMDIVGRPSLDHFTFAFKITIQLHVWKKN